MTEAGAHEVTLRSLPDSAIPNFKALDFHLPPELAASEPPEARGLARDEVRLLVSTMSSDCIYHARFRDLPDFLQAGDVLAINTSGTMNAALAGHRADGSPIELHLSTHLPGDMWIVELRRPTENATEPFFTAVPGEVVALPAGATATLETPYAHDPEHRPAAGRVRLWLARLELPLGLNAYLREHGFPIRYGYVKQGWPGTYYQTVYATEMGSAEMPSAGRAFTPELITRLVARGAHVAPLLLHTGVASLEDHEPPYEEYYRVPTETARTLNTARQSGKRVVAVGTTVVRALETVTDEIGVTHPGEGWTTKVITPRTGIRAVNALLTGLHEPRSTHLAMLEALAGWEHLEVAYSEALHRRYLWHEFGDVHLILP